LKLKADKVLAKDTASYRLISSSASLSHIFPLCFVSSKEVAVVDGYKSKPWGRLIETRASGYPLARGAAKIDPAAPFRNEYQINSLTSKQLLAFRSANHGRRYT
jgi:hypothetical protein